MRQQAGAASPLCRPYFKRNTGISGKQRVLFPRNALREPIELAVLGRVRVRLILHVGEWSHRFVEFNGPKPH